MPKPDPFHVASNERETVRVFAVDLDAPQAKAWAKVHHNIETALGLPLDPEHMESFPAEDLRGLGLAQFLIEGYGIEAEQISPDRGILDAAGPMIVLLRARAFKGAEVTLAPEAPLHLIAAYGQAQAAPSAPTPSRKLETSAAADMPAAPSGREPRGSVLPILIFLGLAVTLFAVLVIPKL